MALTLSKTGLAGLDTVMGNKKVKYVIATFPASYTTAGESLTPALVGLKTITFVSAEVASNSGHTGGVVVSYDYTNKKLFAMTAAAVPGSGSLLQEVASTTNLSTLSVRLRIEGSGG